MSAFMCSARHIAAVADALPEGDLPMWVREAAPGATRREAAFLILRDANAANMEFLYQTSDGGRDQAYQPTRTTPTTLGALKLLHSLRYQSCDTPGFTGSPAERLLSDIEERLVRRLPGYDAAEWSI